MRPDKVGGRSAGPLQPARAADGTTADLRLDPLAGCGAGLLPPVLPEGVYVVQSSRSVAVRVFGRRAYVLHCEVIGGPSDGARLFWTAPLPPAGRRPGIASKLFRAWLLVAGRRPERGERVSGKILEGKRLRGRVETVTKDNLGNPLPPQSRYSIVRDLLELA
jgi:hypothetical protein